MSAQHNVNSVPKKGSSKGGALPPSRKSAAQASGKPRQQLVNVASRAELRRYNEFVKAFEPLLAPTDVTQIGSYTGSTASMTRELISTVEIPILKADILFHQDMSSTTATVARALINILARIQGIVPSLSASGITESYLIENTATLGIVSVQLRLKDQGSRDVSTHSCTLYKKTHLPDTFANGATMVKQANHSASLAIPVGGSLLTTTSKPSGADKSYVYELMGDPEVVGDNKPMNLYANVCQLVVTFDQNSKTGNEALQDVLATLIVSVKSTVQLVPGGAPATASPLLVTKSVFTPSEWPLIAPPSVAAPVQGDRTMVQTRQMPDLINQTAPCGIRADRGLTLDKRYIYLISAAFFGVVINERKETVLPRYAFTNGEFVFFSKSEADARARLAVSVEGAVMAHGTTFKPIIPVSGMYGSGKGTEAMCFMRLASLVNRG